MKTGADFSEGERFAVAVLEELQADFRRLAAEQYRRFPGMRPPCHSCAVNPGTNDWPGQPLTALKFLAAIATADGFYCHDAMPKDEQGWHPTGSDPLCAGWTVLSTLPRDRWVQALRTAMQQCFGDTMREDDASVDELLTQLIALVA